MMRPEHPFDIRPDLRKAASVIRPNQLVRVSIMSTWLRLVSKLKVQKLYIDEISTRVWNYFYTAVSSIRRMLDSGGKSLTM